MNVRLLVTLAITTAHAVFAQGTSSAGRPLGEESLVVLESLYGYDTGIPLNARITDSASTASYRRYKMVLTGAQGDRVTGYLALPLNRTGKIPVALVLHAGSGSKDEWWKEDGFERGRLVVEKLLAANIGVLALDAQFHGDRSAMSDFESFRAMWFDRQWYNLIRGGVMQTVKDYRRALDYLASRPDIDMNRIGVVGYSLGGIIALNLVAFEPRVSAAVGVVAGVDEPWLRPASPVNVASRLGRLPLLLIAGRSDEIATSAKTEALFAAVPGTQKRLVFIESGHRLPAAYADTATSWLIGRLK